MIPIINESFELITASNFIVERAIKLSNIG